MNVKASFFLSIGLAEMKEQYSVSGMNWKCDLFLIIDGAFIDNASEEWLLPVYYDSLEDALMLRHWSRTAQCAVLVSHDCRGVTLPGPSELHLTGSRAHT